LKENGSFAVQTVLVPGAATSRLVTRKSSMNPPTGIPIGRHVRISGRRPRLTALLWQEWRAFWRRTSCKLFGEPVYGNPLHEAWSADGEPLERLTPDQHAKSATSRRVIVPHSRSR
jgi:hypothetical protein